jgi:hypothetical protein
MMTCQFCHQPLRANSSLLNCCCRDQYRRYRRLYYETHKERIIEQQVRYQLKRLRRDRAVNGTFARKYKPWPQSYVERWNRALYGGGWSKLRELMAINHDKEVRV